MRNMHTMFFKAWRRQLGLLLVHFGTRDLVRNMVMLLSWLCEVFSYFVLHQHLEIDYPQRPADLSRQSWKYFAGRQWDHLDHSHQESHPDRHLRQDLRHYVYECQTFLSFAPQIHQLEDCQESFDLSVISRPLTHFFSLLLYHVTLFRIISSASIWPFHYLFEFIFKFLMIKLSVLIYRYHDV